MTDREAYRIIGERAAELAELPEVQAQMVKIAREQGTEAAERALYMAAVASLVGVSA